MTAAELISILQKFPDPTKTEVICFDCPNGRTTDGGRHEQHGQHDKVVSVMWGNGGRLAILLVTYEFVKPNM